MSKQLAVMTTVAIVLLLPACGGPATKPAATPAGGGQSMAGGHIDGVRYEVHGHGGVSSSLPGKDFYEYTAGENKIRIQGDRITVNGTERGTVKRGDSVRVDADGNLTVNDEKR